jgi:GTP-binding protein Era
MTHKAGYINIIGRPNVGKSTLMNQWVGEKLSIITPKAQTTRHRILGIVNDDSHQIVFSDTPGIIFDPINKLHVSMNNSVEESLVDADVLVFLVEPGEKPESLAPITEKLKTINTPKILLLNKCDTFQRNSNEAMNKLQEWNSLGIFDKIFPVSALNNHGTKEVLQYLFSILPESPPYYPKDQLTDRSERFFCAEIIREKILLHYQREIPYSVQIEIEAFEEKPDINVIRAVIFTERESQKIILIGKGGSALKKVGTEARRDMEIFLAKKVFLELKVKIRENWRDDVTTLKRFGY